MGFASLSFSEVSESYEASCLKALELAVKTAPAYASWRNFDIGGDDPFARLAKLPIVDKALMRKFGPEGFVPGGRDLKKALEKGEVEIVNTSGSTGDRVANVWCQSWWDASEKASWKLNSAAARSCTGKQKEAILSSPLCVGFPCEDAYLSKEKRTLGRFLFLNERVDPSGWTAEHMRRMVAELNAVAPEIVEANPSYLARLSRFILKEGLTVAKPSLIVFTYENPSLLHRRQIQAAFGAPMASSYGSTEAGYVFMQCEHGLYHQNVDFCHVDFIPFSERHGGPSVGSLLASSFGNPWRALLRFDIGDVARLASKPCACGRRDGLTLESIEGRAVNLTVASDGRAVTQAEVDRALAKVEGLLEYQLLQLAPKSVSLRFGRDAGAPSGRIESRLRESLVELYGKDVKLELEEVRGLPPDPPGKYRLAKAAFEIDVKSFWSKGRVPPSSL